MTSFQEYLDLLARLVSTPLFLRIFATIILLVIYFPITQLLEKIIERHGQKHQLNHTRVAYVKKLIRTVITVLLLVFLFGIWQVTYEGIVIYLGSFFTIVGIGFFAQWSLLSNISASLILFFNYPFRMGNRIRILDGDNSVEGVVLEVTLFTVKIEQDDGGVVSFPNNLAVQKGIVCVKGK